jgi:DNA-directed RNA polymerase subunit RPC12/RpoP
MAATMTVQGERLLLHVDDAGAVYPLQIDPLIGTQQAKLLASDGGAGDQFGSSVALAGDTALVGAFFGNDPGSAYVFVHSGTGWTQQAKLTPDDGAELDHFGFSVALAGDTAFVGAPRNNNNVGAVYVFVRSGTSWTKQGRCVRCGRDLHWHLGLLPDRRSNRCRHGLPCGGRCVRCGRDLHRHRGLLSVR